MIKKVLLTTSAFLSIASFHSPADAGPAYTRSAQLTRNGVEAVAPRANFGRGVKFGVVDTGIAPSVWFSPNVNGQGLQNIDTAKSGVCLNGRCSYQNPITAPTDTQGHGTFVASEIVGGAPRSGLSSVAPAATVLSVNVFQPGGGANSVDVANGIRFAADGGAQVINLSLGPAGGTAAQQAAFYSSVASAINYAAAKNAVIVFAAGNSAQPFAGGANITGLSDAALQRLLFVGSINANSRLSSFSNSAGTGKFISTTGKVYDTRSLFVVAEGENIIGASNSNSGVCAGYGCISQASGTSMAAPIVTGSIGLLEATWPVLVRNGTATQILRVSATDLGATGIDTSFGYGAINLAKAFEPIGGLSVSTASGQKISVSQVTGSTISSGALGNLSAISNQLSNYTAFDAYSRNFGVNLSSLITTRPSSSLISNTVNAPKTTVSKSKFADGSALSFGNIEADDNTRFSTPGKEEKPQGLIASYTDSTGSVTTLGYGFPASASFASALWGTDSAAASQSGAIGASNALLGLAQGGNFGAYGTSVSDKVRLAVSWSQSQTAENSLASTTNNATESNAYSVALSAQITPAVKTGVTVGLLNEQNGLLGSSYGNSALGFGEHNQNTSLGLSSAVKLTGSTDLLLEAAIVRTNGGEVKNSLISNITDVYSRSYGASVQTRSAIQSGDSISFGVKAPLRVVSGAANLTASGVDEQGYETTSSSKVSLKPTGNALNFNMQYQAPVADGLSWNASFDATKDAENIKNNNDVTGLISLKYRF